MSYLAHLLETANAVNDSVTITADAMESIAHRHGLAIELRVDRAYLTHRGVKFVAPLPAATR